MALNPMGFNTPLNSSPNAFGAGVTPSSTTQNNPSKPMTTSESTPADANPSPSTPNQTMLITGGILSALLAGGLLFWQRKNIVSLLDQSSKSVPAPPQADTFVNQAVAPVTTATQHTPKGKPLKERVGALTSGAKEKAGKAVSLLGMLPEVFGLLGDVLGSARRKSVKTCKWSLNMALDEIPSMFGRIMPLKKPQPKKLVKSMWKNFTDWRHAP